jgi:parallel beta-helix repeat protein
MGVGLIAIAPLAIAPVGIAESPPSQPATTPDTLNVIFVNPIFGDNTSGEGTEAAPLKTIAQALRLAQPNTIIRLYPGIYSRESGETFPLVLKPGVTIQGNPRTRGQDVVIRGGGAIAQNEGQNATILGVDGSSLQGVTVSNPQGYGLWIQSATDLTVIDNSFTDNGNGGILISGSSAPTIRSNYFYNNGGTGITIADAASPEVRENVFENNPLGIQITENAAPQILDNRLLGNQNGVIVAESAQPLLRGNRIENTARDSTIAREPQPVPDTASVTDSTESRNAEPNVVTFGERLNEAEAPEAPAPTPPSTETEQPVAQEEAVATSPPEPPAVEPSQTPTEPLSAASFPIPSHLSAPTPEMPESPTPQPAQAEVATPQTEVTEPEASPVPAEPEVTEIPVPSLRQSSGQAMEATPPANSTPSIPVLQPSAGVAANTEAEQTTPSVVQNQRYRVLVETASDRQQELVRSLVPGAFRTSINGEMVMQAGLFDERENADEIVQLLTSNGLSAKIEPIP